jgi:hypothetical protein
LAFNHAETEIRVYIRAMDLLLARDPKRLALVPATSVDEERLRSVRWREPIQAQLTFLRSGNLQRWYRGLVGHVAEAIDASPDALHAELKFRAGLIEQIFMVRSAAVRGGVAVRLKSTSYPTMDQTSFSHYVDVATDMLCRDYLSGIKSRERQKLILEWVGHRPK